MKTNVPPEQEASPQGTSPESGASSRLSTRQATRRRILAATVGAPVIYTVAGASGAALARSSTCENNPGSVFTQVNVTGRNVTATDPDTGTILSCTLDPVGQQPESGPLPCVGVDDGRTYWYDRGGDNALYTGSCWTSLLMLASNSKTKIV